MVLYKNIVFKLQFYEFLNHTFKEKKINATQVRLTVKKLKKYNLEVTKCKSFIESITVKTKTVNK